jgi:hypothetical protein
MCIIHFSLKIVFILEHLFPLQASLSADADRGLYVNFDPYRITTFSKRAPRFVLCNDLSGNVKVMRFQVCPGKPFASSEELLFYVSCPGPHKAFDIDSQHRSVHQTRPSVSWHLNKANIL